MQLKDLTTPKLGGCEFFLVSRRDAATERYEQVAMVMTSPEIKIFHRGNDIDFCFETIALALVELKNKNIDSVVGRDLIIARI